MEEKDLMDDQPSFVSFVSRNPEMIRFFVDYHVTACSGLELHRLLRGILLQGILCTKPRRVFFRGSFCAGLFIVVLKYLLCLFYFCIDFFAFLNFVYFNSLVFAILLFPAYYFFKFSVRLLFLV